jgi:hypothetical protein
MAISRTAALAAAGIVGTGVIGGVTYSAVSAPATASAADLGAAVDTALGGQAGVGPVAAGGAGDAAGPAAGAGARERFGGRALLRRLEHGTLTLQTRAGDKTVDLQRGTVSAVSPTSISVRSHDGFAAVYAVTSATRVRTAAGVVTIGSVHQGDTVFVIASDGKAIRILDRRA